MPQPATNPRLRQERLERLKRMRGAAAGGADGSAPASAAAGGGGAEEGGGEDAALGPRPVPEEMSAAIARGLPQGKRRRVIDALAALEGSDDDDGEEEDEDEGLDWRRKAV
jgi:hypothetical protein